MTSVATRLQQSTSTTIDASSTRFSPVLDPDKPLLWEKFGLYGRYGQVYDVKLRDDRVSVTKEDSNGATALEVLVKDVIGCQLMKCKDPEDSSAYFIVYTYPEKKVFGQPKRRERQTLTLVVNRFTFFNLNLDIANKWKTAILRQKAKHVDSSLHSRLSSTCGGRSVQAGRCLVLLNPFGGKGKALASFTEQVAPVLAEAEMQYNMVVTERPGHAQELIQTIELEEWKCVLICSGDGLIFEVINGLMKRGDWRQAIRLPVGVIPCGTGNALAAAILWRCGESLKSVAIVPAAAFIVTQQLVSPLDLILVETRASRFYSFLSICYGLIADVDIESEKYRKLGVVRNILGGLVRILDLRTYRCRISYLPVAGSSGRHRLEGSAEPKRRHMSDPNIGGSLGGGGSRKRRSATDTKPAKSQSTLPDATVPSASLPNPVTPSHTLAYDSSIPPNNDDDDDDENVGEVPDRKTLFKYSMSVPNGFGGFIDDGDPNTLPAAGASSAKPPLPSRSSTSSSQVSSRTLRGSSQNESGYSSSESPPDGRANGLLAGLEPIVEEEKDVVFEEPVDEIEEDVSEEEETATGQASTVVHEGVVYDVPPAHVLRPPPHKNGDDDENHYEKIDLTPTKLTSLNDDVPGNWITMETEIVSANILNISHLSTETVAYTGAGLNDGQIFIYIIRAGISKAGLLQMLAAMDNADVPVDHPYVDIIPCEAFRLEPLVEGILTVDGEVIPCSTIQGEVLPGMARVMVGKEKN